MTVLNTNFAQVLLKIYEVEHLLWRILADSGEWSFSDLQGNPIKGISVKLGWGAKFGPEGSSIIGSPSGNPE